MLHEISELVQLSDPLLIVDFKLGHGLVSWVAC